MLTRNQLIDYLSTGITPIDSRVIGCEYEVLVVNREYIDFIREQHFNRVSGDITFKFSYTLRF